MIQITFLDPLQWVFYFYPAFVPIFGISINKRGNTPRERRNTQPSRNNKQGISLARISRAHVFAACKVHWTLRLSGSALRIAFSRYALSEKAGRRASKVEIRDFSHWMRCIARALQRAHVFACVESTLCFQLWASSANRSAFARYALSAHASRSAVLRWWLAERARKIENLSD